jgi:hypothetical protein
MLDQAEPVLVKVLPVGLESANAVPELFAFTAIKVLASTGVCAVGSV